MSWTTTKPEVDEAEPFSLTTMVAQRLVGFDDGEHVPIGKRGSPRFSIVGPFFRLDVPGATVLFGPSRLVQWDGDTLVRIDAEPFDRDMAKNALIVHQHDQTL